MTTYTKFEKPAVATNGVTDTRSPAVPCSIRAACVHAIVILMLPILPTLLAAQETAEKPTFGCATQWLFEQSRRGNEISADAVPNCPIYGSCDIPQTRDQWLDFANSPVQVVRLFFHIVCEDDGSNPAISEATLVHAFDACNDAFKPFNIQFVYDWQYINSTEYREMYTWDEWNSMCNEYAADTSQWVNIFVTYEENMGPSFYDSWAPYIWENGVLGGNYPAVYINSVWWDMFGAQNDITVFHELGHQFGLYHIFRGASEVSQCGPCYERPGAENRDLTGDLCSDTDPGPMDYACGPPGGTDPCSDLEWGDASWKNYMGYAWPMGCRDYFTPQQGARMRCWINDRFPGWIAYSRPYLETNFSDVSGGDGDGILEAGESIYVELTLTNANDFTASQVSVRLITTDAMLNITNGLESGISIPASSTIAANPLEFEIPVDHFPVVDSFWFVVSWDEYNDVDTFAVEQVIGKPGILVVDDDRGGTYESIFQRDFETLRVPIDYWDVSVSGTPILTDLSNHEMVVWFTGDSTDDYLQPAEISVMKDYLDGGGSLFLTGQGLASELHNEDSAFLETYLHCRYHGSNWFPYHEGISGSPVADGMEIVYENINNQAPGEGQEVVPAGGAQAAFRFMNETNGYTAISYAGAFRVVYFSFGYEALKLNAGISTHRDEVLISVVEFLYGSGPVCVDFDADGYGDPGNPGNDCPDDNCAAAYNPDQVDSDADGAGDLCDNCLLAYNPGQSDTDIDGIGDSCDICLSIYDPNQEDADQDGIGDLCDECTDIDGDGYGDPGYLANTCPEDNCPDVYNPDQSDSDLDGFPDSCDNCPQIANADQADADMDMIGNLCDDCSDTDGDGYGNPGYGNACADDNCPDVYNPDQTDTDEDGVGDSCEFGGAALRDTIVTSCTQLKISSDGNIGDQGEAFVTLDYGNQGDCAAVYMFDGSLIIARYTGGEYVADYHVFGRNSFKIPVDGNPAVPTTDMGDYQIFQTGTSVTDDKTIGIETNWYAPTQADSCQFVIQRLKLYSFDGVSHDGLVIGEFIDWDLPSASSVNNTGGYDDAARLVYQQGLGFGCQDNSRRFGGQALLGFGGVDECVDTSALPYGAYTELNSTYVYPTNSLVPEQMYNRMQVAGYSALSDQDDQHAVMTFLSNQTIGPDDTLSVYSVITTVRDGSVDDLVDNVSKARQWLLDHIHPACQYGCCVGLTGNVDADPEDIVDIGDLTRLIDYLFISYIEPECLAEANIDGEGTVDIGDLTRLIDYLFISFTPPAECL
ncbi:MAG: hypothetical protein JSU65_09540 [Candidatus Zixiibacteriota bacterium]|nr:MAG: hypothetical protein JSU65_09540 [candidate division Zixibacteria bacterium]